jgi:hypothetical protein
MKAKLLVAVAVLVGSTSLALAQSNSGGASNLSPGDKMNDTTTPGTRGATKGASEYAPGDRMRDQTTGASKGASELSPGDRMNDRRKK